MLLPTIGVLLCLLTIRSINFLSLVNSSSSRHYAIEQQNIFCTLVFQSASVARLTNIKYRNSSKPFNLVRNKARQLQKPKVTSDLATVTGIELHDKYEGVLKFSAGRNCELSAFFYGDVFETGEQFDAEFDHLDYSLNWEVIFSENKEKVKELVAGPDRCSYYGYGVIVSINPIIADFGCIRLDLGEWSHDERVVGEYIYWKIDRLDISRRRV